MSKEQNSPPNSLDFKKKYLSMATKDFNNNFVALLRTRTQVIYISSNEEKRLLEYLHSVSLDRGYEAFEWDCFKLIRKMGSDEKVVVPANLDLRYPEQILSFIIEELENHSKKKDVGNGSLYILCDFYRYLSPDRCNPQIERQIKCINKLVTNCHVIFTGPTYISNQALEKEIAVLDFPFPNEQEIKSVLLDLTDAEKVKASMPGIFNIVKNSEEELINSVKGLTTMEARQAYSKSIVMANQLNLKPLDIGMILQEKKQIIKKTDILEYVDSNININNVGGLDDLVRWMNIRKVAFSKEAIDYGLKTPKGVLLLGLPGTGKSLTAKAASNLYNMPLLRLDFGKMFNSLVGESEKIARHAIKLAETVAPCVGGDSIVYDSNGKSHMVKNLVDIGLGDEPMYTYSLNENTWKIEKTRVIAAIKHAEKKKMLRITTIAGTIDVTEDHKMMVNREGDLIWVEASNITKDDVLIMPKKLHRDSSVFNMRSIFPGKKDPTITVRVKGSLHSANVISSIVNLMQVASISGMIDANGYCNPETGEIIFSHNNASTRHIFAHILSGTFLTEPEIYNTCVKLKNKVVAKIIHSFLINIGSQNEEIVGFYLGGYFHSDGTMGFVDKNQEKPIKPFISFSIPTDGVFDRLRKALLIFGIIVFKSLKTAAILDIDHIERFFTNIPILTDKKSVSINNFVEHIRNNPPCCIDVLGYKLGKSLNLLKKNYNNISVFEKKDSIIQHEVAFHFNTFLKEKLKRTEFSLTKLVESDVIGIKVNSIESIGEQWAYDLSCEKNNNFFANGFLCHNCILWADEIEKGLAGGVGAGSGDSGTTKRVIGTFLTWLQEKTAPVFVICTANNVQDIPPEFMRAGRFDEVFFVDLPGTKGRKQIFEVLLKRFNYDPKDFDVESISMYTKGFSGAEIEKSIENAMFECFCDKKRKIDTSDILLSCKSISPLSVTRDKEFEQMREWAKGRCKFANTYEESQNSSTNKSSFNLDI